VLRQRLARGQDAEAGRTGVGRGRKRLRSAGEIVELGGERVAGAGLAEQAVKDKLRANTEELMRRGGFGSPTMFVGGTDMFFGNDRLALVRAAVERLGKRSATE